MIGRLKTWHRRQQFEPGPFGWLVNPFCFARGGLRSALADLLTQLRGDVLDVGCGSKPYRAMVLAACYVGLDIDSPATRARGMADVFYTGGVFPFADGAFDGVLCSQVFEHVFNPTDFLAEVHRVLRSGGKLVLTVPFVWDEHEQPHDFARYSSFGLRSMLERAGFEVLEQRKSCRGFWAVAQLASGYVYKITLSHSALAGHVAQFFLIAPINLLGAVAARCLPRHADIYLDNVVLARKS